MRSGVPGAPEVSKPAPFTGPVPLVTAAQSEGGSNYASLDLACLGLLMGARLPSAARNARRRWLVRCLAAWSADGQMRDRHTMVRHFSIVVLCSAIRGCGPGGRFPPVLANLGGKRIRTAPCQIQRRRRMHSQLSPSATWCSARAPRLPDGYGAGGMCRLSLGDKRLREDMVF